MTNESKLVTLILTCSSLCQRDVRKQVENEHAYLLLMSLIKGTVLCNEKSLNRPRSKFCKVLSSVESSCSRNALTLILSIRLDK